MIRRATLPSNPAITWQPSRARTRAGGSRWQAWQATTNYLLLFFFFVLCHVAAYRGSLRLGRVHPVKGCHLCHLCHVYPRARTRRFKHPDPLSHRLDTGHGKRFVRIAAPCHRAGREGKPSAAATGSKHRASSRRQGAGVRHVLSRGCSGAVNFHCKVGGSAPPAGFASPLGAWGPQGWRLGAQRCRCVHIHAKIIENSMRGRPETPRAERPISSRGHRNQKSRDLE